MHPHVRNLYKRFLYVGKDYPLGLNYVREKVKCAFLNNKDVVDELELRRAIHKGRYMVKEMIGVIQLKKYRAMNDRYTSMELRDALLDIQRKVDEVLSKKEVK